MPEITVVITTYNLERWIACCIDDLFSQTFQDFDVLIVDDCSTDNTREIVDEHMKVYASRLRAVYLTENLGSPAKTRNAALNSGVIDGTYTIFLDGDDRLEPDFLASLHARAVETDADITVRAYDRVDADTDRVLCREMQGFPPSISLPPESDALSFMNTSLWNRLIRTELIGETRIPDFKVGEDLSFQNLLYRKCRLIAFVNDILIHYQVRGASVISNTSEETIHAFAGELEAQMRACSDLDYTQVFALTTFIHIGIMALRAKDNPSIDLRNHLRWTKGYLVRYGLLGSQRYLKLGSLMKHGVKGACIWICKQLYKVNAMRFFLVVFSTATKLFKVDIKF